MNESSGPDPGQAGYEEILSALFAQMVVQQANLAMMLMGKVPNPQSGQTMQDLDGARMFIDQLEMLRAKTKGNLSKDEDMLLKQSLMTLQMAFVETVQPQPKSQAQPNPAATSPGPAPAEPAANTTEVKMDPGAAESESKKKFSRKY